MISSQSFFEGWNVVRRSCGEGRGKEGHRASSHFREKEAVGSGPSLGAPTQRFYQEGS